MADLDYVRVEISKEDGVYTVEVFLENNPRELPWAGFMCSKWHQDKEENT